MPRALGLNDQLRATPVATAGSVTDDTSAPFAERATMVTAAVGLSWSATL